MACGLVEPVDRIAAPRRLRVALRREDDPDGRPGHVGGRAPGVAAEAPAGRGEQQRAERDREARQDDLGLRIAEPSVALEEDGTVVGQDQPA